MQKEKNVLIRKNNGEKGYVNIFAYCYLFVEHK
jgi:hypothetical protein